MEIEKTEREVIILRTERGGKKAARRPGLIVVSDPENDILKFAADELKRYLGIAANLDLVVVPEDDLPSSSPPGRVFLLGTPARSPWLRRLLSGRKLSSLGEEGVVVGVPERNDKRVGRRPVVIAGWKEKGVLNGVYHFLEQTVGAHWFPPRISWNQETAPMETHLEFRPQLRIPHGLREVKPAIHTRCCRVEGESTLYWCAANRINIALYSSGWEFPLPTQEAEKLKSLAALSHRLGIRLVLGTFPHIVDREAVEKHPAILKNGKIDITLEKTLQASTRLHCRLMEEFGLDGFDWHPSSEVIPVDWHTPGIEKRSRCAWEALYIRSHAAALRKIHPQPILALVSGWNWINPAWEVKKQFPDGMIAHVVPTTEIIDGRMCDLESYQRSFPGKCWYWLYADVSANGTRAMPALDYLHHYAEDCYRSGNGLAPQYTFKSRNMVNLMYLARAGWNGVPDPKEFLDDFLPVYYGTSREAREGYTRYVELVRPHRDWSRNIQISDLVLLTEREAKSLVQTYALFCRAYRKEKEGVVRDRLKELAITCLHLLTRRSYHDRPEVRKLLMEARRLFAEHYYGEADDGYYHYLKKHLIGKFREYPAHGVG